MKLILRFLKPHWKLCLITILLIAIDVAGALIVPTLASRMLNEGIDGSPLDELAVTAAAMAIAAIISGAGGVLSGYTCAALTSRVGKDMREALYDKSHEHTVRAAQQLSDGASRAHRVRHIARACLFKGLAARARTARRACRNYRDSCIYHAQRLPALPPAAEAAR